MIPSPPSRLPSPLHHWYISPFIVVCIYIYIASFSKTLSFGLGGIRFYIIYLFLMNPQIYICKHNYHSTPRVGGVRGTLTKYITFKSWLQSRSGGGWGSGLGGWKVTGSYLHPPPPHPHPPPSSIYISISLSLSLYQYQYYPISFYFSYLPPPPLNHSFLLLLITPIMSPLSDFSLAAVPPTSLPLFPSVRRFHRHRCVLRGSGSSSPFIPVPARRRPDLIYWRGGKKLSLDSIEESERFVGWG